MPWVRGHEDATWQLVPSVWREFGKRPNAEVNSFYHFRNDAIAIRSRCPEYHDSLGWLTLMQHFGLPTRLLDWSRSLAVAGYFCVFNERYFDRSGAIWLLNPGLLNQYLGSQRTPSLALLDNPAVSNLAKMASEYSDYSDMVLSTLVPATHERLSQQRGVFTIHGGPQPLEDRPQSEKFLFKAIIPATAKEHIARDLACLGVSRTNLFPDIETLAKSIKETIRHGITLGYWGEETEARPPP